jgi:hypothetical protein
VRRELAAKEVFPKARRMNYGYFIGDKISIRASDDVEVSGVTLTIRDQGGTVLESGAAVWTPASASWVYTATTALAQGQAVSIEVTATDRPGHSTLKAQERA